ncbi:hypothetical protein LSCM1_01777 [Leishmania martiniquensis]|uniref:WLM domain-containing protein n=1 Tax=Leishmania martiniquensis TaxID=1580590 RepID=A0A836H5S5_9TRYP|nr:hypothetical protein LSCM1_01777 [Leishmania martiniquensis]
MSSAFMAQLPCIGSSSTLGWLRDDVALSYMEHILQRARVLLPRRGWRVGVIKEFYPRGASLLGLNVNAGSEVCIRFRVPGKKNEFLPFHEVLCTALHEFTHCAHSRHDRPFWNLYYDLVKECEALEVTMMQKGMQLYPELSYLPMSSSATASQQRRHAREGWAVVAPSGSRGGGHQLGGVGALGSGRGRGGGTSMRVKRLTRTISKSGLTSSSGTFSPGKREAFPVEGRRLGGVGHRQCSGLLGCTPTRDALRRILAEAASRRLMREPTPVAAPQMGLETVTFPRDVCTEPPQEESQREVDDDGAPDCVPQTLFDEQEGSGWRCLRCGFLNDHGVVDSCAFCADCDDGVEGEGAWLKRPRVDGDHLSFDAPKKILSSVTASSAVPVQRPPPPPPQRSKTILEEKYIVLSDDDDS